MSAQPARLHRPDDAPQGSSPHGGQQGGRRLGRGLNALLGSHREPASTPVEAPPKDADGGAISVELIERNPFQPRQDFAEPELKELAESITRHGVLQPLLVREVNGEYQLIAGERRLMAAKRAGLETVPCRVLKLDDKQVCEAAIEENIKRKDLHPLEKAKAFRDYLDRFGGTVEALAKSLSISRPAVSNLLRLLDLEPVVAEALRSDKISAGHARALLALSGADQVAALELVIDGGLSVRAAEKMCRDQAFDRDKQTAVAEAEAAGLTAPVHVDDTDWNDEAGPEAIAGTIAPAADQPADEPPAEGEKLFVDMPSLEDAPTAGAPAEPGLKVFDADAAEQSDAPKADDKALTPHLESVRDGLKDQLGCPVEIVLKGKESGQIRLSFADNDAFEALLKRLRAA
ncbi:ParB/RepB/Spo0J family partition protein [Alienimonas californiensis]|uniref:Chromosome-partitioning protein Spo0J n=1 Tax=Alienimonas californiensis TaxID=2527989 RepID=A0A517P8X0_9PLAN|nr:ParB/RepB/Spo0J family partition protein [Alienimonas californiensis]QDT15805.1 Chromosome-partitioning protein Spo0J [Alienimonas californiensis]